jgi:nitrite reductase/ring-hydroxylating ferredoxin subunit
MLPTPQSCDAESACCAACDAACDGPPSRREFLRESGSVLAGIAVALGLTPGRAAALTLGATSALRSRGAEVTYPIPTQDGVMIDKEHQVILVRDRNAAYAFSLSCPHQRTPLKWLEDERRFRCPKHKSQYQPDGTFISGRATRGMDRYAIRRDGETVVVDLAKLLQQDKDLAGWDAAVAKL